MANAIVKALITARSILAKQGLSIDAALISRLKQPFVPGAQAQYTETSKLCQMVLVQYKAEEIDGTKVRYGDFGLILLDPELVLDVEPEYVVELPPVAHISAGRYAVKSVEKMIAGKLAVGYIFQVRRL